MSIDDLETDPEDLSLEELVEALKAGKLSFEEVRENDILRRRIGRLVVKQDMEEHRDIYDRLAEV
ncbi:hypothetical protein [Halomicrobium sp. LC1Hm]|uniref:hypothetical protein n=1 Tax=Halomicrobium sp. LC1Hm TaxID=2610902 RepID=UPI0012984E92|nr:hypothetical protein [Halomicrobium sp. LC1Hm]QGA83479.1 hypothetical protein LC1Hm_2445 [Halomicrobium sp. LC1Hm]